MTFTHIGFPAIRLFSTPTTVKRPRPMASKMKKVYSRRTIHLLKIITTIRARNVMSAYEGCIIQKGFTSRSRSLRVPPPTAVTKPTTKAPKRSKFFLAARRTPLIANAKVPI